jgi:hypothetical protein
MALRRIVDAGRLAPSLYNTQPVRFVVVRDRDAYAKLRAGCNKSRDTFMKGRKFFAAMNKRLNNPAFVSGLERQASGDVLPEHGYAIVTLQDDTLTESVEACSCALMAMQLEATALGLASAFCSWTRGLSFQKDMVAMLEVPAGFKISQRRKSGARSKTPFAGSDAAAQTRSRRRQRFSCDEVVAEQPRRRGRRARSRHRPQLHVQRRLSHRGRSARARCDERHVGRAVYLSLHVLRFVAFDAQENIAR